MPICDLGQEYRSLKNEIDSAVGRVLASGHYILGPEAEAFERSIAAYCGARYAVGCNSGTDALLLAMRALDIGPGDEVILPAMTFIATAESVALLGAKPIFVDIDPETYTLDPKKVEGKITSRTKAVIAVHLYGHPADLEALEAITRKRQIPLVEDMAQAVGAEIAGKRIGSRGVMACLSFFPTKNLGACGDAGAVLTSDEALNGRLKSLRNHGAKVKYQHEEVAYNTRLDELQAAILSVKLTRLDPWNDSRRRFAAEYTRRLQGLPIRLPTERDQYKHVFHLYCVASDRRDALKDFLEKNGITPGLHYPQPLHLQKAFVNLGYRAGEFPVSERLSKETLSLPLYPEMHLGDVEYVSATLQRFFGA